MDLFLAYPQNARHNPRPREKSLEQNKVPALGEFNCTEKQNKKRA